MGKRFGKLIVSTVFGTVSMTTLFAGAQSVSLDPARMQRIGTIDERFQSYNVEMLEVTGGKFWKPYSSLAKQPSGSAASSGDTPAGMDPNMYELSSPGGSRQRASTEVGRGSWSSLRTGKRDLGKYNLLQR
jgi:hypothetical protein